MNEWYRLSNQYTSNIELQLQLQLTWKLKVIEKEDRYTYNVDLMIFYRTSNLYNSRVALVHDLYICTCIFLMYEYANDPGWVIYTYSRIARSRDGSLRATQRARRARTKSELDC